VAAEIIHDDDVAWFEDREELLRHIGAEALTIDRTVEDARGGQAVAAQGPEASGKPSFGPYLEMARAGLSMSYSSDLSDGFRHAAIYVAKILGGTKPGDLAIEQASKFIFAINLKTAKALGIAVPSNLLALADEVIE
jgi:ABC-type uncharacterized transport system substrate-binding protein